MSVDEYGRCGSGNALFPADWQQRQRSLRIDMATCGIFMPLTARAARADGIMLFWSEAGVSMSEDSGHEAAQAYAKALAAALKPVTDEGVTQRNLADEVHVVASTISRYLSGNRIAPPEFVDDLSAFLTRHGHPLTTAQIDDLHALRREAQKTSRSPGIRLLHAREQVDILASLLSAARAGEKASTLLHMEAAQRLADVESQLAALTAELEQARRRLQSAEADRDRLQTTVEEQEGRLRHAAELVRAQDAEITQQQVEVLRLRRETNVLRRQVERLIQEEVSDPSAQVNHVAAAPRQTTADESLDGENIRQAEGTTSTAEQVPASEQPMAAPLPQPSAWAQPGGTERFMHELRRLWQESRASDEALDARGLKSKRVERILRANVLPASYLPFVKALAETCGGDDLQWEADWRHAADWPITDWNDSPVRPPRSPLTSAVRILAGAIGLGAVLFAPVFVYLNAAAYIAACRAENGPPWLNLLGWAVAGLAISAFGWFVLTVAALVIVGWNALDEDTATEEVVWWSLIGSVIALLAGLILPLAADISEPGNWWAHVLGVLHS